MSDPISISIDVATLCFWLLRSLQMQNKSVSTVKKDQKGFGKSSRMFHFSIMCRISYQEEVAKSDEMEPSHIIIFGSSLFYSNKQHS